MSQTETDENSPNTEDGELEAICKTLSVSQLRFVVARQEHTSDKAAAEYLGISPSTVKDWKYKGGIPIDRAVDLMAQDGVVIARTIRRRKLAQAMLVKVSGLDSEDERLRQSVSTEIIEWEMGRATQGVDIGGKGKDGALLIRVVYGDDGTASD